MKIVTTVEAFVSALKLSVKPEKKSTIPVLNNILLDGSAMTSTNLDLWGIVPMEGKATGKGPFLVPYYQTLAVLTGESGKLTIEHTPATTGTAKKAAVVSKVRFILAGCEFAFDSPTASNFPTLPPIAECALTVLGGAFKLLLDRTLFAISKEESRYTLNGAMLVSGKESLEMIATDGHRMSLAETSNKTGTIDKTIIHRAALEWLRTHVNGSVCIGVKDGYQTFRTHGVTFLSRVMTGQFPDYQAVLPRESKITLTIPSASKLHPILQRVSKCADERSGAIRFAFGTDALTLSAQSIERGSAKATYPAPATGELKMGLNSTYILEFLKQCGDVEVAVSLRDEHSAILLSVPNWRYIAMPMRM